MCGIVGIVNFDAGQPVDERVLRQMCGLLEHRGPDDHGFYVDGGVGLGMRRLSIIDVAGGHQPVTNEQRSVWAVFNGEIYNFQPLRERLISLGHEFTSRSDSETIVHAYEEFGLDFARHLEGMFAIALWDAPRKRLVLARDRFGKKPLFYASTPDGLVFGSELKSLMPDPRVARDVDPRSLDTYLTLGYVPAPWSILRGVRKLRPAHMLVSEGNRLDERCYWQLEPRATTRELSASELSAAVDQLESLLEAAVRRRLVADVPLGAFLSAGLDSGVVVALMARLTGEPVHTFTIGLDDPSMNEAPLAAVTARALGTRHVSHIVKPDLDDVLPRIVWGMDEPQADASCVPTYYVSRLAREHVTVCLTGDGGDEIFAGYTRYAAAAAESRFDALPGLARRAAGLGSRMIPRGVRGRGLLTRMSLPWQGRYASGVTIFDADYRQALYTDVATDAPADWLGTLLKAREHPDLVSALQWVDVHSYLTDDILAKVDRMSMINSLETRCPLLDREVVEFAFGLPLSAVYADGVGKIVLRRLAARLLPEEILSRPKTGFGIPVARWLRGPLRPLLHDAVLGGATRRGWFDARALQQMVREHERGFIDHGQRLWALLSLELWAQQFLDRPVIAENALVVGA